VTTESLRHYDRIGLLKPFSIDEKSKERFYTIYQYEKLGTIKELKQLGLSLKEIQLYFNNRNIDTAHELLEKELKVIDYKIQELTEIKKSVISKIEYLKVVEKISFEEKIELKEIHQDRYYLMSEEDIKDEVELSYEVIKLEAKVGKIEPYLPIFASNRYAGLFSEYHLNLGGNFPKLGIQVIENEVEHRELKKVQQGEFLTLKYKGSFWDSDTPIKKLINYAQSEGIEIESDILQIQWLDYSIIDNITELLYEIQIKTKR
jgi:DNA-binding transcriptional MerR regulator